MCVTKTFSNNNNTYNNKINKNFEKFVGTSVLVFSLINSIINVSFKKKETANIYIFSKGKGQKVIVRFYREKPLHSNDNT
jgi:hypothetical protein